MNEVLVNDSRFSSREKDQLIKLDRNKAQKKKFIQWDEHLTADDVNRIRNDDDECRNCRKKSMEIAQLKKKLTEVESLLSVCRRE